MLIILELVRVVALTLIHQFPLVILTHSSNLALFLGEGRGFCCGGLSSSLQFQAAYLEYFALTQQLQQTIIRTILYHHITLLQSMNKSKSQTGLPVAPPNANPKPKGDFVYKNQDDMYLFQNKDLFLQVEFKSPIKQICQYLEQYEKYCFLSDLSSIGIKASQQRQFYNKITTSINNQFKKYLQKTLLYIEQIIMNVHFMKYQRWHYYSQIIKGYKNHIINKNVDCYNFNPEQFTPYLNQVMDYLKNVHDNSDTSDMKRKKMQIISNRKVIQKKINEIHDTMYVKNPFITQNQRRVQIRSDELFESYMKKFAYQTMSIQSSFDFRFHSSYDSIRKFPQFMKQFTTKAQNVAYNIIKQYNESCSNNLPNSISKTLLKSTARKQIEMNDYFKQWKKGERVTPILRNQIERVTFTNRIVCRNEETNENYTLLISEQPKFSINLKNQQQDEILNNRIPANNPYFDFWEHVYDRNRLRKLQLFFQKPKIPKRHHHPMAKVDVATKYRKKFTKQKRVVEENIYWMFITARNMEEQKIWQMKSNITDNQRKSYQFSEDQAKKSKYYYNSNSNEGENNKIAQLQKRIQAYREYTEKHEKEKRVDEQLLPVKLKRTNNQRNYVQYALKFGLKDAKRQIGEDHITRYGIKVPKNLYEVKDVPKLQEFLFNFLREKLFREVQKYKDKETMALMLNIKSAEQFCNWKTIKRLGQLTQSMKKYYIWASEIIKYEEETTINKQTSGKFTIYAFSDTNHSKTLLFELKRRLNIRIVGQIIEKYYTSQPNSMEAIVSKLELVHRLIFNQHIETPNADFSFKKGQQIFNLILKQIMSETSGQ